jgi:predicted GNAT family N-acyltransferase
VKCAASAGVHIRHDDASLPRFTVIQAVAPVDRQAALEIRRRVFAEEQGVADLRVSDPDDARSLIALAYLHENGAVVPFATGRLTPTPFPSGQALIAWVATLPEYRGIGGGHAVMCFILNAADQAGTQEIALAAQVHAEAFYGRLGFTPVGPLYDVRGIAHRRMIRRRPR